MPDRVGPPTPRNEPWRMPSVPLGEQPGRTPVPANVTGTVREQFAARDAAFAAWASHGLCVSTTGERAFVKAVFCAGWEARKRAQYETMVKPDKKLDTVRAPVATIFPTDAELG